MSPERNYTSRLYSLAGSGGGWEQELVELIGAPSSHLARFIGDRLAAGSQG